MMQNTPLFIFNQLIFLKQISTADCVPSRRLCAREGKRRNDIDTLSWQQIYCIDVMVGGPGERSLAAPEEGIADATEAISAGLH